MENCDMENEVKGNVLQKLIDMMDEDAKEKLKKKKGAGISSISMTIISPKGRDMSKLREKLMGKDED
jgi:hypothetical protein